jgi:hypothetical protein
MPRATSLSDDAAFDGAALVDRLKGVVKPVLRQAHFSPWTSTPRIFLENTRKSDSGTPILKASLH